MSRRVFTAANPSTGARWFTELLDTQGVWSSGQAIIYDGTNFIPRDLISVSGEVASGIADHVAGPDPHTQYLLEAVAPTLYTTSGWPQALLTAHVNEADPHTQYLLETVAGTLYEASGTFDTGIAAHLAALNPHPQYLLSGTIVSGFEASGTADLRVAWHEAKADPHPDYLLEANYIAGIPEGVSSLRFVDHNTNPLKSYAFEIDVTSFQHHDPAAIHSNIYNNATNDNNRTTYGVYSIAWANSDTANANTQLKAIHGFTGGKADYTYNAATYAASIAGDFGAGVYNGPNVGELISVQARMTAAASGNITEASYIDIGRENFIDANVRFTKKNGIKIRDITYDVATNVDALLIESQVRSSGVLRGNLKLAGGNYNNGHIQLSGAHVWSDGTDIYFNNSAPTSSTDGTKLNSLESTPSFYVSGAHPTATESLRGTTIILSGVDGSPDVAYMCLKNANGTYGWAPIGAGSY